MMYPNQDYPEFKVASRTRRFFAFCIDYFFIAVLIFFILFFLMGSSIINLEALSRSPFKVIIAFSLGLILYFMKDSIKGVSFGKWILGLKVRELENPFKVPSFESLLIRNLFQIIWPIEFIAITIDENKRRLGDKVTNTRVFESEKKIGAGVQILLLVSLILILVSSLIFSAGSLMKNSDAYKVAISTIKENYDIRDKTGGIKSFGFFPTGTITRDHGYGSAKFKIKVIGNKRDLYVSVKLRKMYENDWEVTEMEK